MGVYQQTLQCKKETNPPNASFFYFIPKALYIKTLDIMTNQNCPATIFFQPQSEPIQTHFHFNGIN